MMVVSTVKSENITNLEANPLTALDKRGGQLNVMVDAIAVATTSEDEVGDIIMLGPIPSNAKILDIEVLCDALDGVADLAYDVGLYYSGIGGNQALNGKASGDVIDADCFATAVATFQAAKVVWTSLRFEVDNIVDWNKEAWAAGNLSADPGGLLYLGLTCTTPAETDAAGDVIVKISYL